MVDALKVATDFHEAYERLAPSFGYETRTETRKFDPESPNGKLMMAVCHEVGSTIADQSFRNGFEQAMLESPSRQG
jgi:hypothetical protein